ncbi:hypothetical protein LSUE1_G002069 [Lachnellula suecica]|uniref:Zn(2)-C6 fungal-type domain-containing protein n=1 Tax=Lachnellula suecica TaxID=602035 RepID=A0A8T9CF50_9HELO|nr:hypothetical protein LSUE1_G002069 [Lachnellula suecica]
MPSTSGNSRAPRQRTFTSCTECRRRKQKCNQGRPCANCLRRPTPPPHGHMVDLYDDDRAQNNHQNYQQVSGSANDTTYTQASQSNYGSGMPTASTSQQTYSSSQGYYSTASTTRGDYRGYQSESSSSQHMASSPDTSNYTSGDGGYYQQGQMGYSSETASSDVGYHSTSDEHTGNWLSPSGDPAAFVGAGVGEYYYASDEPEQSRSMSSRY